MKAVLSLVVRRLAAAGIHPFDVLGTGSAVVAERGVVRIPLFNGSTITVKL